MNTARNDRLSRPVMEQIEGRLLLDGNVTAVVAGNTLKITGDNLGNVITLTQNSNVVTITPDVGTSINGQTAGAIAQFDNSFKQIRISMGDGHDDLTIDPIVPEAFLVGSDGNGQLKIDMGKGPADQVTLLGVTSGNVDIRWGDDGGSLVVGAANPDHAVGGLTDIRTTIAGNLAVRGGKGADSVALAGVAVSQTVKIDLRDGNDSLTLDTYDGSDTDFGVAIGKDLFFSNGGTGADAVQFLDSADVGAIGIAGGVRLNLGQDNSTVVATAAAELTVGKDMSIQYAGNGVSTAMINNAAIARDLSIRTGDGTDSVALLGIGIGRNARVDMGKGSSSLLVEQSLSQPLSTIGGELRIALGDDADTGFISEASIGKLRIDTGKGDDQLTIEGTQAGEASVSLGDGTNTTTITGLDPDGVDGDPDIQTSVTNRLTVTGGKGNDTVTLAGVSIGNDARVDVRQGNDHVTVDTYNGADADFSTVIGENFVLNNSAQGSDTLSILDSGNVGSVVIGTNFSATLGDGSSSVLATSAAALTIGENASLRFLGKGSNQANLTDPTIGGNLDIRTGSGVDTLSLLGLVVGNNATVNTLSGPDTVTIGAGTTHATATIGGRLNVDLGAQDDALALAHATLAGAVLDGGAGTDTLDLDTMTVTVEGTETIKNFE